MAESSSAQEQQLDRLEQQTVEALSSSEQRLRKIFEYSNDAIFVIDPKGDRILEANPKASKLLGYSREELLNSVAVSSIHPHELSKFQTFGLTVLQQGHGWTNELSCMTKSGVTVPSEISAAVVSLDGQDCIISMVRDITERKQAQAAMERLAEIGELAAMIVHEVRSPLTTILMGLESFRDMDLSDRAQRRLDLALEEADRLKQLLSEILQYAREPVLEAKPLDLTAFCQDIQPRLTELLAVEGRSLVLESDLPEAWIDGDADKLKQVFINLVRNACEAVAPGDTVTWCITSLPQAVCISVHNGGDPIPPEVLAKLGQPFFTTKLGGNGLGVAIVKRIVAAHSGKVAIESTAEAGTTVRIMLPLRVSEQ
ncbi:two-component system sensor histidine kinase NtrB [Leptolyngbya sp. PCC 6406]|uniref:two-component system sensor histidine kinase NtrB n=1 Tax=Leptolyngbya sp. PCC 6406 TaxID=1173264 RepID=UPI00068607E1|nr:ATP-binding protein [Leptolyngbya sp. PCC 6406]